MNTTQTKTSEKEIPSHTHAACQGCHKPVAIELTSFCEPCLDLIRGVRAAREGK